MKLVPAVKSRLLVLEQHGDSTWSPRILSTVMSIIDFGGVGIHRNFQKATLERLLTGPSYDVKGSKKRLVSTFMCPRFSSMTC
jgi:hypothetical protein